MNNFHSIENEKQRKQEAYDKNLRKSNWSDLGELNTAKLAMLLQLGKFLELYSAKNHDVRLQAALDGNTEFQALIKLTINDIASINNKINGIAKTHPATEGKVEMGDLATYLRISEQYMELDESITFIQTGSMHRLSEIFQTNIDELKSAVK